MVKKIKLCLVGAGSIGRRHLRLLCERDDTELCVVDPSQACCNAVREMFPSSAKAVLQICKVWATGIFSRRVKI